MSSEKVVHLTDADFESAIKDNPLIIVDFWADWCHPCKIMAPVIDELAEAYDNVKFAKLNVDESPTNSAKFSISGIPSLLLFKDGQLVDRIVGAVSKEHIEDKLKPHF